jgi:hypothetical protein
MERRPLVLIEGRFTELPLGDSLPVLSEDNIVYAKRFDTVSDSIMYKAEAAVGSVESAAVWRIRKITIVNDDVTETWASGNANFDKIWDNRASLIYT